MSEMPDYYALLGVLRSATPEEIKRAYYEAAQRLHPDKNKAPGETEFFLEVQQAYEVLSDAKRRARYNATLPPEPEVPPGPVVCRLAFSRSALVRLNEPQLIYVLLDILPAEEDKPTPSIPLNLCLVLDRSTSMQGEKLDTLKAAAIQLMRTLKPQDIFSVVIFSDRAEVLIPAGYQADRSRLDNRIQMIQHGGATEILSGLDAGFNEVRLHANAGRINHIILLTDGHTYGDEPACLELAGQAAAQGIGISGLGIGKEWNDIFLDDLTARTGGSSAYIARPQDIQRLLIEKFNSLARVYAEEARLDFTLKPGIALSDAFRLQPDSGPIPVQNPLMLGPILQDTNISLLLEFTLQPPALKEGNVSLLDGLLKVRIPSLPLPPAPIPIRIQRPITRKPDTAPPPAVIIHALSRLSLYRMQEKARSAVEAGDFTKASRHLKYLASRLLSQGEQALAHTALLEAENLARTQLFSEEGRKEIKYGTRTLCLPGKT